MGLPDRTPRKAKQSSTASQLFSLAAMREHSLLSLLELNNHLTIAGDLFAMAEVALLNIMGHFGSTCVALWVVPEDRGKSTVLVRTNGWPFHLARAMGAVWGRWLGDARPRFTKPLLVNDLTQAGDVSAHNLATQHDIAVLAPVQARGRLLGVVALGNRVAGGPYEALDLQLLHASLSLLGVAIADSKLFNETLESNRLLRRANEDLQQLDELKSSFLQTLNHELRTPLGIMLGYLEIMTDTTKGARHEDLRVVQEEARKLEALLINLLDFSELADDTIELSSQRTRIEDVLSRYYEDRRPGVSAGLRELRLETGEALPPTFCDAGRIIQILDCLVDNTIKFTPPGSRIHLRAHAESIDGRPCVQVDVADDGPGISSDRLPFIFESFRQGDGSLTRERGGLGMGLSLARRLAEKMEGRLEVKSEIGKGTIFSLVLPQAA